MRPHIFCFCLVLCSIARVAATTPPSIASASPDLIDAGGPYFLITVNGSGFVPGSVVNWGRSPLGTTFVSSTQLAAAIIPELRAFSGKYVLTVTNPGGPVSDSYLITVSPVLSGLTPAAVLAGSPAVTITAKGIGFTRREVLVLNASGQQTVLVPSYVDSGTLTAVIPADALSIVRTAAIQVLDPLNGNTSSSLPFDIRTAPVITSASPSLIDAAGPYFLMNVTGTGFHPGSVVNWPGAALGTTFVSSTQLAAAITPEARSLSGTFNLTVTDPVGATSNPYPITLSPVLFAISPPSAAAAGPAVTITATGAGFTRNSILVFNAWGQQSQLATTYVNSTTLTATIPAGALRNAGLASVQAADSAGVGRSFAQPFTIFIPSPAITSISPNIAPAGAAALTVTVNGNNFGAGATVLWNGSPLATTSVSATQLIAAVPANLLNTPLAAGVTVSGPGGIISNSLTFTVDPPGPTIGALSPSSATAGAASLTLTVTGLHFAVNCVLRWNGSPLETTFVSPTQATAAVPARLVAAASMAVITLINPSGLTSNTATFTIHTPAPTITSISPTSAPASAPAFTLAINGANFTPNSMALWNRSPLATTVISASQLTASVPASLIAGAGAATIAVALTGAVSNKLAFTVTPPLPATTTAAIVNAASLAPLIAPGSLITIYGVNLAAGDATAPSLPLPNALNGTSVTINGIPAPLIFVSSTQINAQAPFETEVGTATLMIQAGTLKSAPVPFEVTETAPGVLTIPGSDHALARNDADGAPNSTESPARPGESVVVYLTGQGPLDHQVATGAATPANPPIVPLDPIQAQVGGLEAGIAYAALVPGSVGLLQMAIVIPELDTGEQPFEVSIGGVPANSTVLSVKADQ
jgi:uncharacterized protein (TIGR03437 family)